MTSTLEGRTDVDVPRALQQPARSSSRRSFLQAAALGSLTLRAPASRAKLPNDPLPSWHDGTAKRALLDFVEGTVHTGGPHFIPRRERIAVFDNDGTLWCERPSVEELYMLAKAYGSRASSSVQHDWRRIFSFQD